MICIQYVSSWHVSPEMESTWYARTWRSPQSTTAESALYINVAQILLMMIPRRHRQPLQYVNNTAFGARLTSSVWTDWLHHRQSQNLFRGLKSTSMCTRLHSSTYVRTYMGIFVRKYFRTQKLGMLLDTTPDVRVLFAAQELRIDGSTCLETSAARSAQVTEFSARELLPYAGRISTPYGCQWLLLW